MMTGISILGMFMMIGYGLLVLLGLYALYLLIKFLLRAIEALDIYLNEKRGRRF